MRVWHGYEIDFPKLKDTDMADLQKYTSDLGNALSRELLKFNSQLANMQNDIEDLEAETVQNDSDLEATKQFIENSMKTLSAEGTSIHVEDSADYGCTLKIEGKSEQTQEENYPEITMTLDSESGNYYLDGVTTQNGTPSPDNPVEPINTYTAGNYQTTINNKKYAIKLSNDLRSIGSTADRLWLDTVNVDAWVEKKIRKEDYTVSSSNGTVSTGIFQRYSTYADVSKSTTDNDVAVMSNVFKAVSRNYANSTEGKKEELTFKGLSTGTAIAINISGSRIGSGSNDEVNKFLKSVNAKIYYILETPKEITQECYEFEELSPDSKKDIVNVENELKVEAITKNILPRTFAEDMLNRLNVSSIENSFLEKNGDTYFHYAANLGYQTGKNYFIKDEFEENTQYVFKAVIMKDNSETSGAVNILSKYTDGTANSYNIGTWPNMTEKEMIIVTDEDKTLTEIGINYNSGTTYINLDKYILCKLEENVNTEELEYEPCKKQTVTFPFSEGQKLMAGGYLGKNGVVNKRKQVVLDGTESWVLSGRQFEKCACFHIGIDNNPKINMLCNAFKYNQMAYNNSSDEECITNNVTSGTQNIIIVQIDKTRLTTQDVAGFKAWLAEQYSAGTPVIVEYEMQEEETTAYTSTQQTAYNTLQKFKTYRTTTNISNSQNTNMQLTYKMDLQTQIAGGGSSA